MSSDLFMVLAEFLDRELEHFASADFIIPNLLDQSSPQTKHVFLGQTMGGIKAANVNPLPLHQGQQDNGEIDQSSSPSFAPDQEASDRVEPDFELLLWHRLIS